MGTKRVIQSVDVTSDDAGLASFRKPFFCALPCTSSVQFVVTVPKTAGEPSIVTTFVLSVGVINQMSSISSLTRKVPLVHEKLAAPFMLKLQLDLRRGSEPRTVSVGPLTRDQRYARIAEVLAEQAAAAAQHQAAGAVPVPTVVADAVSGTTEGSATDVGSAKASVRRRSSAPDDQRLIELRWDDPVACIRIVSVSVWPGERVATGTVVARAVRLASRQEPLTRESGDRDLQSPMGYFAGPPGAATGAGAANNAYGSLYSVVQAAPPRYSRADVLAVHASTSARSSGALPSSSVEEVGGASVSEPVVDIVWQGAYGVAAFVGIREGSIIAPQELMLSVDCHPRQQMAAHLMAVDKLAWENPDADRSSINTCFQTHVERLVAGLRSKADNRSTKLHQCCVDLERVARDFTEVARTYGRVIISELHLPTEAKTVRPINVGGVLGGANEYPDPIHIANKVQGHNWLKAYFGWFFNRGSVGLVSFPLTAIIDFKGHRITAMTQLPISGEKSLIYGCGDAGKDCTVKNEVPEWSQCVREASMGLKLKPHWVVNGRTAGGECELASCVDLEGHRGADNRFYLLDFSRTFPPVYKDAAERQPFDTKWPFYFFFRPEFLARWPTPLSADACSNFQSTVTDGRRREAQADNNDVREATEALKTDTVMAVCQALLNTTRMEGVSVVHTFHQEGLNMRYVGRVYSKLKGMYQAKHVNIFLAVLIEALMRVFKNHLRAQLRHAQAQAAVNLESVLVAEAARVLNAIFVSTPTSHGQWRRANAFAEERLHMDFSFTRDDARRAVMAFLVPTETSYVNAEGRSSTIPVKMAVLLRLNEAAGLGLSPALLDELRVGQLVFSQPALFEDVHIKFEERVKHLDVVDRARALGLYLRGTQRESFDMGLLLSAYGTAEKALECSPLDPWLCFLMAEVCAALWTCLNRTFVARTAALETQGEADVERLMEYRDGAATMELFRARADKYYRQATALDAQSMASHRGHGKFLAAIGDLERAEESLICALEVCQSQRVELDQACLDDLLAVLHRKGSSSTAATLADYSAKWRTLKQTLIPEAVAPSSATSSPSIRERSESRAAAFKASRAGLGSSSTGMLRKSSDTGLSLRKSSGDIGSGSGAIDGSRSIRVRLQKMGDKIKRHTPGRKSKTPVEATALVAPVAEQDAKLSTSADLSAKSIATSSPTLSLAPRRHARDDSRSAPPAADADKRAAAVRAMQRVSMSQIGDSEGSHGSSSSGSDDDSGDAIGDGKESLTSSGAALATPADENNERDRLLLARLQRIALNVAQWQNE